MKSRWALLTDLYQLTMVGGYVHEGKSEQTACFDYFFRRIPDGGGYAVSAGLDDIVDYILNLRFTEDDLAYLDGLGLFPKEVIKYLEDFRFTGDLWAMPEGTVVFPQEPVIRVTAPPPAGAAH